MRKLKSVRIIFSRVHLVRKVKNKKTYVIKEQDLNGEATKTTWKVSIQISRDILGL